MLVVGHWDNFFQKLPELPHEKNYLIICFFLGGGWLENYYFFRKASENASQKWLKFRKNCLTKKLFNYMFFGRFPNYHFFLGCLWREPMAKTLQTKLSRKMQMFLCFSTNMLKQSIRWSQKAESGLKTR